VVTIYHNPRCSKSRETLALLESKGVSPDIRLYLNNPPSKKELTAILKKLGLKPSEFVRRKETAYTEQGLSKATEDAILAAMLADGRLIERPVVVNGDNARIGRPPESVLDIL
jgi:arsenate reductase